MPTSENFDLAQFLRLYKEYIELKVKNKLREELLAKGEGGGNWRRLIIQATTVTI